LGSVILTTVQHGVGQPLVERQQNINLFRFTGTVLPDKLHNGVAGCGHGFQVSGKGESLGDDLALLRLRRSVQGISSSATRSSPAVRSQFLGFARFRPPAGAYRNGRSRGPYAGWSGPPTGGRIPTGSGLSSAYRAAAPSNVAPPEAPDRQHRSPRRRSGPARGTVPTEPSPCTVKPPPPGRERSCRNSGG